jgi:hypothetical protein
VQWDNTAILPLFYQLDIYTRHAHTKAINELNLFYAGKLFHDPSGWPCSITIYKSGQFPNGFIVDKISGHKQECRLTPDALPLN